MSYNRYQVAFICLCTPYEFDIYLPVQAATLEEIGPKKDLANFLSAYLTNSYSL